MPRAQFVPLINLLWWDASEHNICQQFLFILRDAKKNGKSPQSEFIPQVLFSHWIRDSLQLVIIGVYFQ